MIIGPEFFAVSGLLNGAIALVYGVYLFIKKHSRDTPSRYFFFLTIAIAVWGFAYWAWLSAEDAESALRWVYVLSIGSFYIPVFFFHWITKFLNDERMIVRVIRTSAYIVATCGSALVTTPYVVAGIGTELMFPYWPHAGPLYTVVIGALYVALPLYAIAAVMRDRRSAKTTHEHAGYTFLLLGIFVGFGSGLTNFPLWYGIPFPPYGTFFNALFPLLFAYSSVRHHLFNAKVIGSELLVTFMLAILFVEIMLAETTFEYVFRTAFFLIMTGFSYLLIRSVYKEIENREKGERLARYLANANARLRELDKQKTEFVSIASHQLRGPIAAIVGYSSLTMDGSYGSVPKGILVPIRRIFESGKRISIMVDDFLNVTRIEQGRMSYNLRPCDVNAMVAKVVNELGVIGEQKGLTISYQPSKDEPVMVAADESKLAQVFQNLLDNAIKYTVEGSVTVTLTLSQRRDRALIIFTDTGIGIAADELHNLFQKFNRASNANSVSVYGAGLGLYIAREIVKAHEGWIHIASPGVGKGTTFTVELPLAQVSEAAAVQ